MSWDGGPCWFCKATFTEEMLDDEDEFDWHMSGDCLTQEVVNELTTGYPNVQLINLDVQA